MDQLLQIEARLLELGLFVESVSKIGYGEQIRLGCGAVVNVYDKGTVVVQGKLHPNGKEESLRLLKQALPSDTRWGV